MDEFGLVETVDGFGQGVVIGIADAADGGFDASLEQALVVLDGHILTAPVRVVNQPGFANWSALTQGLFESIQDKPASAVRGTRQPTILRKMPFA